MWSNADRIPQQRSGGFLELNGERPSPARPFGLKLIEYADRPAGRPRPQVRLCPQRQIGLVGDVPLIDTGFVDEGTISEYNSDGSDNLATIDVGPDDPDPR